MFNEWIKTVTVWINLPLLEEDEEVVSPPEPTFAPAKQV